MIKFTEEELKELRKNFEANLFAEEKPKQTIFKQESSEKISPFRKYYVLSLDAKQLVTDMFGNPLQFKTYQEANRWHRANGYSTTVCIVDSTNEYVQMQGIGNK